MTSLVMALLVLFSLLPLQSFATEADDTVMLQYDADADMYTASVTDTNGILKYYNYQSAIEGLTFEKADNTLTITATPAAVAQLGSSGIINSRGHEVTVGPDSVIVWNTEGNDAQTIHHHGDFGRRLSVAVHHGKPTDSDRGGRPDCGSDLCQCPEIRGNYGPEGQS